MSKLLLVEDDNNLREIYQARLMAEGYDIVAAQDGEEALVMAKKEKPDLIISDVMMPRISGFEMLDILRNTEGLRDTKIIMLTALSQNEDQNRADKLGADKYLVKSQVTLEDIVKSAKQLLGDGTDAAVAPPTTDAAPTPEPASAPAPTPAVVPVAPAPEPAVAVEPAPAVEPAAAPVAADPAPAPEPAVEPATPASVIEPAAAPETEAAEADKLSQSLAAEEKAIEEQIESFAKEPGDDPVEAAPQTTAEAAAEANDTAVLENAVEELNSPEPDPAPALPPSQKTVPEAPVTPDPALAPEPAVAVEPAPAVEPAAAPAAATTDSSAEVAAALATPNSPATAATNVAASESVSVAGKKIIKPLNDVASTGPKLDELLAKEAANTPSSGPAPVVGTGGPNTPPPPQPGGQSGLDPTVVTL